MIVATRNTALLFVDIWAEYLADGILPHVGSAGQFRPADDPPPGLFMVIQVERSFASPEERQFAVGRYVLRAQFRELAKEIGLPIRSAHRMHVRWLQRLRYQIQTRCAETVVEAELARWHQGKPDPICDMAARLGKLFEGATA